MNGSWFHIADIKLTFLYIITVTFLSDRKSVGRNDSHIFCARPCYFSLPGWCHWLAWQPHAPTCTHRIRHAQKRKPIVIPVPQSVASTVSLTMCAVAMKSALFWDIKISEFGKWVERHDGDYMAHMTSDDIKGDQKVAQPSCMHTTKSVALATRWWPSGWVRAQTLILF